MRRLLERKADGARDARNCLDQRVIFGGVLCREAALIDCGGERLGGTVSLARPLVGRRYGVQGGNPPAFILILC